MIVGVVPPPEDTEAVNGDRAMSPQVSMTGRSPGGITTVSGVRSMAESYVTVVATAVADGVQSLPVKIQKKIRAHWRLLTACLFMVILGVVMGMVFEDWEFLTSLYVIVQIVTTIGYGDVTVQTEWMKLFMTFYVLASLLVVANFFNLIFDVVIESNVQSIRSRLRQVEIGALANIHTDEEAQKEWGTANRAGAAAVLLFFAISTGTLFFRFAESCTCSYGSSKEDFGLQQCDDSSYDTCVATGGLQMSWASALYMSVITVTTVGFGDHSPKSRVGRVIGIIWMLLGVAVTAYFVKALSDVLAWEDEKIEFEGAQNINKEIFHQMDKDGNGYLSKDEYALYVLVKHNLVSKDVLSDIYAKYDSMDTVGQGQLTYPMLRKGAPEIRKRKRSAAVAAAELRAEPPPEGSSPKSPLAGSSPKAPPMAWAV